MCSHDAIQMVWNTEGFLVPQVDTSLCINCGLCSKKCIALEEKPPCDDKIENVKAYAGWNKNDSIHINSSSGGIFTGLAEHILHEGGVIFGVVWKDKYTAGFAKASTIEELKPMRGSKYTPAIPGKVYQNVREELKSGKKVLFSGTPCQVRALKKYLHKSYENLITIDIVCHGIPSHIILEKYIAEDEKRSGKTIAYVSFRDKPDGWKNFHVTRHYVDGSTASESQRTDLYMRMFLCDKALNVACYNCPYAHIPRQGDITLGDYWGVERFHQDWSIDKGVSAILANTSKGESLLQKITDVVNIKEEAFSNIYSGQGVVYIRPQKEIPQDRKRLLAKLNSCSLSRIQSSIVDTITIKFFRVKQGGILHRIYVKLQRLKAKLLQ